MNLQGLSKIEHANTYLDFAFSKAKKDVELLRSSLKGSKMEPFNKKKSMEVERIRVVRQVLTKHFRRILHSFPREDDLTEFYKQLIRATLDYTMLKKSYGAINWISGIIEDLSTDFTVRVKKTKDEAKLVELRKSYVGRVSSLVKQIKKNLEYLEEARLVMLDYPTVKKMFTVTIAGFPNVGKSTLLSKVTSAKPKIGNYAFTTKTLNIGYFEHLHGKVQMIDTPGTLNRFDKMNPVEKQAYLAMRYCANLIVYVYDLTDTYPMEKQDMLYGNIKEYGRETVIYLSKTDLIDKKRIDEFKNHHPFVFDDKEELMKYITKKALEY